MAYVIPQPIVTYNNPSAPVASVSFVEPREGKFLIPVEIDWDGTTKTFLINVQGITTQPFSQIVMLDVDNSLSGADVTFYFPDTQDTLVVPAESGGLFPVFTRLLQTYASSPGALATDVTRFRFLNYRQEPISLPPPEFSDVATALNLTAAGTTALIPAGVSGTLVGYSVNVGLQAGAGDGVWTGTLKDHATGMVIDQASVTVGSNATFFGIVLNAAGIALRFSSGLDFVITNSATAFVSQQANVAARYRTP